MTKWMACLGLIVLTSALAGCNGQSGPKVATLCDVSGTVDLDGQPMADGEISFSKPGAGPTIIAVKDGKFAGKTSAGEKRVEIRKYIPGKPIMMGDKPSLTPPDPENILPAKYNAESKLTATIPDAGKNDLKFEVTSK